MRIYRCEYCQSQVASEFELTRPATKVVWCTGENGLVTHTSIGPQNLEACPSCTARIALIRTEEAFEARLKGLLAEVTRPSAGTCG
jgi:hypothetical protein